MARFYGCHKVDYLVLGDAVSKLETFVWILNWYFKVHNLVSIHPKSIIFDQMTNVNMIFHVMVSDYRLVKIWNSPQFGWISERSIWRQTFRQLVLPCVMCNGCVRMLKWPYTCSFFALFSSIQSVALKNDITKRTIKSYHQKTIVNFEPPTKSL